MMIAVSSQNFRTITGHAGKTRRFLVFSEGAQGGYVETARLDLPKHMSMHEFSGDAHPLDEMDVLITAGCGEGFIRKMGFRGVRVIATSEPDPLNAVTLFCSGQRLPEPVPHSHA